nr:hypothetical protein CFP56_75301 [Quercus suber]
MSKVRSSDMETGLSLSDDRVISEATSPSTPYKAWTISCSLTGIDEKRIRNRFSKQKLAEAQEKKAKGGIVSGLLSKKHSKMGDVSKEDPKVTSPPAHLPTKCPASPTLSLENDADTAALKAHEALFADDLSRVKLSSEVMSSPIQKLVQALGESLFVFGKLLDLEKRVATSEPMIKSLSAENETFKNKVTILIVGDENDKERVATLEKSPQAKKDFYKLKDKHW